MTAYCVYRLNTNYNIKECIIIIIKYYIPYHILLSWGRVAGNDDKYSVKNVLLGHLDTLKTFNALSFKIYFLTFLNCKIHCQDLYTKTSYNT